MAETTENVETIPPEAGITPAPAEQAAAPDADPPVQVGGKNFVPFFNEDYQFRLGTLGDMGLAYRLVAIFLFMVAAAVMMYLTAWWWVGTHPLAHHH